MGKKLTDEFLKWTLDIDGKPAMAALNSMEQQTKLLRNANQALYNEMVKLESQGKKNSDEYKALDKQYKENNTTISLSRARMEELRKEIGLNGLTATQLNQRMKEIKRSMDSSLPNSDAWKKHKKELEEVSARYNTVKSGATTTQVIFGKLGVAVGGMSGPIAGAINGIVGMGRAMWALVANPVGATIAAIVGALTLLYSAFTKTDTGAVAMAGALKAVGNVMDVLLDRSMNMFKTLWSLITFDWAGLMKNGEAAFGGLGKALGSVITAGTDYAKMMDDIDDREVAAANRMTKLRVEIETLKNKAAAATGKVKLDMLQQAMDKEIELNGIEKGFLAERNDVENMNLASKMQNDKLTQAQKEEQLKQWLAVDDKELESLKQKDSAFAEFMDKNEAEFQKLQKSKADELDKEAELQTGTRRLQKGLATERKAENDKAIQDAKDAQAKLLENAEADNKKQINIINKRHLDTKNSEAVYQAELSAQDSAFLRKKMTIYKEGSKEYEEIVATLSTNQVKQEQVVKELLLQAQKELTDAKIENIKDGIDKEKTIEEQRWTDELAGLKKRSADIIGISADEIAAKDAINKIIEEKTKAHNTTITNLNTASALEAQMDTALIDEAKAKTDQEKFAAAREIEQAQYDQELADAKDNAKLIELAEKRHSNALIQIKKDEQARRLEVSSAVVDAAYNMFGALVELVGKETALGKALFAFQQAAAIGQILINTAVANSAALAEFPGPVGIALVVMNTISAAAGIASVIAQTAATFSGKGDKSKGKQSGGYADSSSSDSDPSGIYHANEFIASAPAVRNPTVKPILDIIDIAQRTGTIKNLNLAGVLAGGRQAGGYAASSQSPAGGSSIVTVGSDPELKASIQELNRQLKKGIRANMNKYGSNSLSEAMADIAAFQSKIYQK